MSQPAGRRTLCSRCLCTAWVHGTDMLQQVLHVWLSRLPEVDATDFLTGFARPSFMYCLKPRGFDEREDPRFRTT